MISDFMGNIFILSKIEFDGHVYSTVEHAFQAAKCEYRQDKQKVLNQKLKKIGRKVLIKSNWDSERVAVMKQLLQIKFSIPKLKVMLQSTRGQTLVEGNYWHDLFWGSCKCSRHQHLYGKNMLGRILMKIRDNKE